MRLVVFLVAALFSSVVYGQDPVKWTFKKEQVSNTEFDLVFTAKIEKGWNTYSMYTEDNGPVPTALTYESKKGISLVGKAIESGEKKAGMDDIFGVNVIKFLPSKDL